MTSNSLLSGIGALSAIILFFLLGREFMCWYWKINERVALLEDIKNLLMKNKKEASSEIPPAPLGQ